MSAFELFLYRFVIPVCGVIGGIFGGIRLARLRYKERIDDDKKRRDEQTVDAANRLIQVNTELKTEQVELNRVRAERTSEIQLELTDIKSELTALKKMYGEATLQLQQSAIRELTLRSQIEELQVTNRKLTARVAELESINGTRSS